jgi:hypothetical protein
MAIVTRYGHQIAVGGAQAGMLYVQTDGVVMADAIPGLPPVAPDAIREAIAAVRQWFAKINELAIVPRGKPDSPYEESIATHGTSGKLTLKYRAGSLVREADYDPRTGLVTTRAAGPFSVSVWSWLNMHEAYLRFCSVAEAQA